VLALEIHSLCFNFGEDNINNVKVLWQYEHLDMTFQFKEVVLI